MKKFSIKTLIPFVLLFFLLMSCLPFQNVKAEASFSYDKTNVLYDLKGSTINGKEFQLSDYGFDKGREFTVLTFIEYGYSFYEDRQEHFGLYVITYNPQGLVFKKESSLNKIQLSFNSRFSKYPLKFLNESVEPGTEGLFYKFKVVLTDSEMEQALSVLDRNSRSYTVSGVELLIDGQTNATEYPAYKDEKGPSARTFIYTGFSHGLGANVNDESTLSCITNFSESITLDVKHTYWRSLLSDKGVGYQNQVNAVYFRVPNRLIEEYGKLQRIKAEWYEYKTQDIVVTSDQKAYDSISPWIGKKTDIDSCDRGFVDTVMTNGSAGGKSAIWAYNAKGVKSTEELPGKPDDTLYYLFKTNDIESYDPYAEETSIGGVSSNELYDYILSYDKSYTNGTVKDGMISADLFEADIDDYRKVDNEFGKIQQGYSFYDFDVDTDILEIKSYDPENHHFNENYRLFGFFKAMLNPTFVENYDFSLSPILLLGEDDLEGTDEEISDRLFVSYNDVQDIQECYTEAKKADETVVLFRFALTDYYANEVDICCNDFWNGYYDGLAYRAWQSVFLDFDVIQLTFTKDDVETIIPVVANPIDIVPPITPPTFFTKGISDWIWIACGIVAVCVIGIVVYRHVKKEA